MNHQLALENGVYTATLSFSKQERTMRIVEVDGLGDDVGVDNPYWDGDGLGGYPSYGDASKLRF